MFTFDCYVIGPLYYVSLKCRDPDVRQEALDLLAATRRREGMWDSVTAAKVLRRVMDIEKAGDIGTEESGADPGTNRALSAVFDRSPMDAAAAVDVVVHDGRSGGWRLTKGFVAWKGELPQSDMYSIDDSAVKDNKGLPLTAWSVMGFKVMTPNTALPPLTLCRSRLAD